jgi:rubredoxin
VTQSFAPTRRHPEQGGPEAGIGLRTKFEDLPDDWVCPECGAIKDHFEKEE